MAIPDSKKKQETKRNAKGQFLKGCSGNAGGRSSKQAELRKRLEDHSDEAINQVIEQAKMGEITACRLILDRVIPPSKPIFQPIQFNIDDTDLLSSAKSIIKATADGILPADHAKMLLDGLASMAKIIEVEELTRRIDELEEQINHANQNQ